MIFLQLRDISLEVEIKREELNNFLAQFDLALDEDVEEAIGAYDANTLVAVCCRHGKVLKGFAIQENYQSHNITSLLVSEMIKRLFSLGIYKSFVFTKHEYKTRFESLGYRYLAQGERVVLLETGLNGIDSYVSKLIEHRKEGLINGCIVMNCNPFTLGHRYLIRQACNRCEKLYIILVQEDRSLFPYSVRKRLVLEGIKDLLNVVVIDGDDYTISSATFPAYFIREENEKVLSEAKLDIDLFTKYTAPALNIVKRFAGSEPYDPVTAVYNKVMLNNLPQAGIEFVEIERLKAGDRYISASEVRRSIREKNLNLLNKLVPESTLTFLLSPEGEEIREKIIRSISHH